MLKFQEDVYAFVRAETAFLTLRSPLPRGLSVDRTECAHTSQAFPLKEEEAGLEAEVEMEVGLEAREEKEGLEVEMAVEKEEVGKEEVAKVEVAKVEVGKEEVAKVEVAREEAEKVEVAKEVEKGMEEEVEKVEVEEVEEEEEMEEEEEEAVVGGLVVKVETLPSAARCWPEGRQPCRTPYRRYHPC